MCVCDSIFVNTIEDLLCVHLDGIVRPVDIYQ